MTEALQWGLVSLGILVVIVRRRYVAIALVTIQAAMLGIGALTLVSDHSTEFLTAGIILLLRSLLLGVLLVFSVRRTREPRPLRAPATPLLRLAGVVVLGLVVVALVPPLGLVSRLAEQASVALLAMGTAIIVIRRATVFHLLGLLVAENGLGLAALSVPGGFPLPIELGAAIDLVVLVTVAIAFHERIFGEFGTGDATLLRGLRD